MSTLLFVSERYPPDPASAGQHLSDLAEYLVARGWKVSVLTGSAQSDGGQLVAPPSEYRRGVSVRRWRTIGFGRASRVGRLIDALCFYLQVLPYVWWAAWRARDTRVVYLTSPPMVSVMGYLAVLMGGPRYGIWSLDLHPEAEIAAGMLAADGVVARALVKVSAAAYRRADFVIAIGTYMRARIAAYGVSADRQHVIPVWAEGCTTTRSTITWRDQLGLHGRFVVMYSGNAGIAHDFAVVLDAMRLLRDDPRVFFLFVGSGPRRSAIEAYIAEHGLTHWAYLPYFSREAVPEALAAADAHLVSLRSSFVGISIPGKTFGVMAAGRPIVYVGPAGSEVGELVCGARCGVVVEPDEAGAADRLADIIRGWATRPDEARVAGQRGRALWHQYYRRDPNCAAIESVIRETWT